MLIRFEVVLMFQLREANWYKHKTTFQWNE